jgi:hypothetical protein
MNATVKAPSGIETMDTLRYTVYLGLLQSVFERVLGYYGDVEKVTRTSEAESMALYVEKILATVYALRLKHSFSPEYLARPGVDLADSGFPHYFDISMLDADLSTKVERLPKLHEIDYLRNELLDLLMKPGIELPARSSDEFRKLQWQIAERAFLEYINLRNIFLRYTPGKLFAADDTLAPKEKGRRGYHFSWGCYDPERNRPCVYFMYMTHDESEEPLDKQGNPEFSRFLQTIDNIASRAPKELAPVAVRIDETFKSVHPKILKRVCLGSLISPMLWEGKKEEDVPQLARILLPAFQSAELDSKEFVLFFSTEMLIAEREESPTIVRSVFGDKPRQIFHVPKNDRGSLHRGVSAYHTYCILPHRLRQHLSDDMLAAVLKILDASEIEMLTYQPNEEGVTNVG